KFVRKISLRMEDSSYSQLLEDSIRLHFERNGTLDEMRSGLHVKVLQMLHSEKKLKRNEPLCGGDLEQRGLVRLLNHLVVDYFEWYGYKHTLETFALETGINGRRSREYLQRELKETFDRLELPILLQLITKVACRDESMQAANRDEQVKPNHRVKPPSVIAATSQKKKERKKPEAASTTVISRHIQVKECLKHSETRTEKQAKKYVEKPKQGASSSNSNSSFNSPESTDDNTDYSSETYGDIPNRYYYRDEEPPESSYPAGFGEEGPYEG
ncbi:hypothetical protein KR222_008656, partial [Zaprionus bogoriensis]